MKRAWVYQAWVCPRCGKTVETFIPVGVVICSGPKCALREGTRMVPKERADDLPRSAR